MNNCADYFELISAHVDGELSQSDKQRLEEHLSMCAGCASILRMLRGISLSVEESCVPAPESLSVSVMQRIRSGDTQRIDSNVKKFKLVNVILTRYLPIAACLVFLLLTVPRLFGSGGIFSKSGSTSAQKADTMPRADGGAADAATGSDNFFENDTIIGSESSAEVSGPLEQAARPITIPAGDASDAAESGAAYEAPATGAVESNEAASDAAAPEDTMAVPELDALQGDSPGGSSPDDDSGIFIDEQEPPSSLLEPGSSDDDASDETVDTDEDSYTNADSRNQESSPGAYFEGIYAIIMITGKMPDTLRQYDPIDSSFGGERYYEIPRDAAEALIGEISSRDDVLINTADESGTYARVYYTP